MYASHPDGMGRKRLVRHHLKLVRAATADASLPFAWREMHYGCNLLLNAPRWHLAAGRSATHADAGAGQPRANIFFLPSRGRC